jgi:hypothetical protein
MSLERSRQGCQPTTHTTQQYQHCPAPSPNSASHAPIWLAYDWITLAALAKRFASTTTERALLVLVRDARTGAASFTLLLPAKPELATRIPLNCCCMVLASVPGAVVLYRCSALLWCYKVNSLCNALQVKVGVGRCMPVQGRSGW